VIEWQPSGPEPGKNHSDIPPDPAERIATITRDRPGTGVIILTDPAPTRP
jgi:hypothetical protein